MAFDPTWRMWRSRRWGEGKVRKSSHISLSYQATHHKPWCQSFFGRSLPLRLIPFSIHLGLFFGTSACPQLGRLWSGPVTSIIHCARCIQPHSLECHKGGIVSEWLDVQPASGLTFFWGGMDFPLNSLISTMLQSMFIERFPCKCTCTCLLKSSVQFIVHIALYHCYTTT